MSFTPEQIKIYYADIDARTPARCNRSTGEIYINVNRWPTIPPEHRVFILLHEMGHIVLNTSDEVAVDSWAQDQYIKGGYPLTESVKAITRVLPGRSQEQFRRAAAQLNRARAMDGKPQKTITMQNNNTPLSIQEHLAQLKDEDSFLGIGKKAQERKAARVEIRNDRKRSKIERKNSRAAVKDNKKQAKADAKTATAESRAEARVGRVEVRQTKADAKKVLADQGIVAPSVGSEIGGAIGSLAGKFFGGGGDQGSYSPEKKGLSTGAIAGIVLGSIVLLMGIVFMIKKSKQNG